MSPLLQLAWQFALLSLVAFGGGNATLPEIQRIAVEQHHWLTDREFANLFAVAQAAPGPNILIVALVGLQVAGISGALAATVAMCLPTSLLIYYLSGIWQRLRHSPWRRAVEAGVAPLAVGLVLSGGWLMATVATADWRGMLLTAATVFAVLRWPLNPLWWIAAGALLGLAGAD